MTEYYVYILHCSDDSFYVGVTNDLQRRWEEHQFGTSKDSYTFSRRPLKMAYRELHIDVNMAIAREKQIQKWTRAKKQALIDGDKAKLKALAKGN